MGSANLSVAVTFHNTINHASWLKFDQIFFFFYLRNKSRKKLIFSIKVLIHCLNLIPINQQFVFSLFSHYI